MTYEEAVQYIENVPKFKNGSSIRGKSPEENLKLVLESLGNPHLLIPCIHVAGTNGKGSTANFMARILAADGNRVGIFTSPHLIKINERICIIGDELKLISDDDFLLCFEKVYEAVTKLWKDEEGGLSFFEYVFAIAAVYFSIKKPDVVVYEVGLGGRLDATNVIKPVVSVITSIGLDHTQYLGDTIEKVAYEKAGIIKQGVPVVYNTGNATADRVIEKVAKEKNAGALNVAKTDYLVNEISPGGIDFSMSNSYYRYSRLLLDNQLALYQVDNAITAIEAVNCFMEESGQDYIKEEVVKCGLKSFVWPGRLEKLFDGIYVDGAHNPDAIEKFIYSVASYEKDKDIIILFAVAQDKDYEPMIKALVHKLHISGVVVTKLDNVRCIDSEAVAKIFSGCLGDGITALADDSIEEAVKKAVLLSRSKGIDLFCVGSLYLIGSIKALALYNPEVFR